jgi:hypothetical protein
MRGLLVILACFLVFSLIVSGVSALRGPSVDGVSIKKSSGRGNFHMWTNEGDFYIEGNTDGIFFWGDVYLVDGEDLIPTGFTLYGSHMYGLIKAIYDKGSYKKPVYGKFVWVKGVGKYYWIIKDYKGWEREGWAEYK